jgi:hypothetical protein
LTTDYKKYLNALFPVPTLGHGPYIMFFEEDDYFGGWAHHVTKELSQKDNLIYALAILFSCGADEYTLDSNSNTLYYYFEYSRSFISDLNVLISELKEI